MTRYYFRADYGGNIDEDDVGEVFSTLDEAVVHAAVVAGELGRNNTHRIFVAVVDEAGAVLAEVAEDRKERVRHRRGCSP
jgi:hypothetical protein